MKITIHLALIVFGLMYTSAVDPLEQLTSDLFDNYKPALPPHYAKPSDVSLGINLESIKGLDMFQGTTELSIWMKLLWNDPRLVWDPSSYDNITILRILETQLWKPDILLYNSIEHLDNVDVHALVYSDGTVYYLPPMIVKASCAMDLSRYPYDTQKCSLKWGSWAHDTAHISLTLSVNKVVLEDFTPSPYWDLISTSMVKNSIKYPCCAEIYEHIVATVELRRRSPHGLIAPAVITSWLILVVFLISPTTSGERIIFAGFVFVALVVQVSSLSAIVPDYMMTSLGRFLLASMLITAIITVINALLYTVYPRGGGTKEPADDNKRRIFLFFNIGALVVTIILLSILTGAFFA